MTIKRFALVFVAVLTVFVTGLSMAAFARAGYPRSRFSRISSLKWTTGYCNVGRGIYQPGKMLELIGEYHVESDLDTVKAWYDGRHWVFFGAKGLNVYSPPSSASQLQLGP